MAIVYVSLDFFIDIRPANVHSSYQFHLQSLPYDEPQWLNQDNLTILLIKRSQITITQLNQSKHELQDSASAHSVQPANAKNPFRSLYPTYYVSYATGTDFGCMLELEDVGILGEICGPARYDFAGRAIKSNNQFQNLIIPDYNFNNDFSILTIRP